MAASACSSQRSRRTGLPETAWNTVGRDQLLGAARHDDAHFGALVPQAAHEVGALVGGDAARDAEKDFLPCNALMTDLEGQIAYKKARRSAPLCRC